MTVNKVSPKKLNINPLLRPHATLRLENQFRNLVTDELNVEDICHRYHFSYLNQSVTIHYTKSGFALYSFNFIPSFYNLRNGEVFPCDRWKKVTKFYSNRDYVNLFVLYRFSVMEILGFSKKMSLTQLLDGSFEVRYGL